MNPIRTLAKIAYVAGLLLAALLLVAVTQSVTGYPILPEWFIQPFEGMTLMDHWVFGGAIGIILGLGIALMVFANMRAK